MVIKANIENYSHNIRLCLALSYTKVSSSLMRHSATRGYDDSSTLKEKHMKFLIKAAVLTYVVKRIAKSYLSKA
ncbi:hypothetical protein LG198_09715 [Methylobacillus arboreus]|uniref:hypothetical protein n=1 Tax=Methylobacillus arboreus TaxID=755170 RepID=UPI001E5FA9AB|nr:hypothetical protein [Methylobacillus arboreus]MCB5191002.1 hypothetical protein [Methylobacillus arboreus]